MSSILDNYFMMKYNFYSNNIPIYSKVKFITIINDSCLIEDINTKNRIWVMKSDIYPLCNKDNLDNYGDWIYCEYFHNIAKNKKYL